MQPDTPHFKQMEAIVLSQERNRPFPSSVAAGLLAIPIAFVTFVIPLVWGGELWFVFVMDALLVGGFIAWRLVESVKSMYRSACARPNIDRLRSGDTLVHWRYEANEWQRFTDYEYRRDRAIAAAFMPLRQTVITGIVSSAVTGGIMLFVNVSESSRERPDVIPQGIIIGVAAMGFIIPLFYKTVHAIAAYIGDRRAADARQEPPEIRINATGMDGAPSGYMAFLPRATKFMRLNEGGLSILEISVGRKYTYKYGTYTHRTVERILIPRGRESEAEKLTKMVV